MLPSNRRRRGLATRPWVSDLFVSWLANFCRRRL